MKNKAITMIGIAAIVGAIAIFFANMWISKSVSQPPKVAAASTVPQQPAVKFKTIVVAKQALNFGAEIAPEMLAEIPWAEGAVPEGASETVDTLLKQGSRVVLARIEPNEPVLLSKLSGPGGRATLSTLLAPGMRAVTIRVDELASVGGLVTPGDRVDVVLTRDAGVVKETEINASGATGSNLVTEIVLENVKVLSVGGQAEANSKKSKADTVTLEVTPADSQKIALASSVGGLSLALRGVDPQETAATGITTISSFAGSALDKAAQPEVPMNPDKAVPAVEAPKVETRTTTVIVTRGIETQTYTVVAPQN